MSSEKNKNNLLIITGEISGDLIGAALVKELKKINNDINVTGIGGDRMKAEGMELIYHIDRMAFLGFAEVIKHLPFIKKVQNKILELVKKNKIGTAVLIDYPGFNLSIAKKLKSLGLKVIYYVSPQLWAWGKGRVKKVKKYIDKMLVVFPFEKDFYKAHGIDVEYVGHPLVERVKQYEFLSRKELDSKFNLDPAKEILLLLPGSRKQEVEKIFPECIKAASLLSEKFNMQVVVLCSVNINENIFHSLTVRGEKYKVIKGNNFDLLRHAKFGIIKSGTSTLEAGYFALPMIIVYKTSSLTYLIGKKLVKMNRIGMANILLDEDVVTELIQDEVNEEKIFDAGSKILSDEQKYTDLNQKLNFIKTRLGGGGASIKAAGVISTMMNES